MADEPIFDLYRPYPKAVVEGPRQAIIDALEESYFLTDTLFELLDRVMTECDATRALAGELAARVDALEAAAVPPTVPTPEVAP